MPYRPRLPWLSLLCVAVLVLAGCVSTDPSSLLKDEQLAFWLNAYNALALKLITDNYPTVSIRRITPVQVPGVTVMVPGANDPFKVKVGYVGGQERTLNEIEHKIIRAQFVGTEDYDERPTAAAVGK